MNKTQRLEYMKKRFPQLEKQIEESVDAVLSVTRHDLQDEVSLMESAREENRDRRSQLDE